MNGPRAKSSVGSFTSAECTAHLAEKHSHQVLARICMMSPSLTTYVLPSSR